MRLISQSPEEYDLDNPETIVALSNAERIALINILGKLTPDEQLAKGLDWDEINVGRALYHTLQ